MAKNPRILLKVPQNEIAKCLGSLLQLFLVKASTGIFDELLTSLLNKSTVICATRAVNLQLKLVESMETTGGSLADFDEITSNSA